MAIQTYISNNSPVQIIIGNMDYTPYVVYESVHVNNNLVMTSDTCDLIININPNVDKLKNAVTGATVTAPRPRAGMEIIWQNPMLIVKAPDGSNQPYREFAGVVVQVIETEDFPNLQYAIHAKSYTHWLDRQLVVGYFNQGPPETIIKSIVNNFTQGFTTYNVQSTNVQVVPQYFDYRKVSDAIKSIADQLEMGWYCDYWRDLHFMVAETFTSPFPNNIYDVDNDVTVGDLTIEENGEQQINRIFIKGFKIRSSEAVVLTYVGDAASSSNPGTTQWSTGYRLSSGTGDIQVQVYPSKAAYDADAANFAAGSPQAGVAMTIKKDVVDGTPNQGGASNTCYVHYTQHLIRIPNYNNAGPVPSGYIIAVRFHYMKDTVYLAQDPAAQSTTAALEGTSGVYEAVYTDKSLTNSTLNAVQAKGQLLLSKYRYPQIRGTFTTYFNSTSTQGWRAGQYFQMKTSRRFGGINEVMFVQRVLKSITKNDSGGLITFYNIEFADSPYLV